MIYQSRDYRAFRTNTNGNILGWHLWVTGLFALTFCSKSPVGFCGEICCMDEEIGKRPASKSNGSYRRI
jgi:hypothetical protein